MNKISCDICQDLMPLVKDEVASDDSKKAVLEHINSCETCKTVYGEEISFEGSEKNIINKIKKNLILVNAIVVALGILFGMVLACNQFMFYNIIIMPIIGAVSYSLLRKKSVYVLLAVSVLVYFRWLYDYFSDTLSRVTIETFITPLWWAIIYLVLTSLGAFIAFLLYIGFSKEKNNKKTVKIVTVIIAVVLIGGMLFVASAFLGNTISRMIVTHNANKYVEETYPNTGYFVDSVNYDFKCNCYFAHIKSSSSKDTYFTVSYNLLGEEPYDNYESSVAQGNNTWIRLNDEYKAATDNVINELPFETYESFQQIQQMDENDITIDFGLDITSLEPDKVYDLNEMGEKYGKIELHVYDDELTAKRVADILLETKKQFNDNNLSFYEIDLVLRSTKNKDVNELQDDTAIRLEKFLYSDITESELVNKVEKFMVK